MKLFIYLFIYLHIKFHVTKMRRKQSLVYLKYYVGRIVTVDGHKQY